MQRCEHDGPHYRSVPKGQVGPWLCAKCLEMTEHEPSPETVKVAENIRAALEVDDA